MKTWNRQQAIEDAKKDALKEIDMKIEVTKKFLATHPTNEFRIERLKKYETQRIDIENFQPVGLPKPGEKPWFVVSALIGEQLNNILK